MTGRWHAVLHHLPAAAWKKGVLRQPLADGGEGGLVVPHKALMGFPCLLVPAAKVHPAPEEPGAVDIALLRITSVLSKAVVRVCDPLVLLEVLIDPELLHSLYEKTR